MVKKRTQEIMLEELNKIIGDYQDIVVSHNSHELDILDSKERIKVLELFVKRISNVHLIGDDEFDSKERIKVLELFVKRISDDEVDILDSKERIKVLELFVKRIPNVYLIGDYEVEE